MNIMYEADFLNGNDGATDKRCTTPLNVSMMGRQRGISHTLILHACEQIKQGKTVMILSLKEDDSIKQSYTKELDKRGIEYIIERQTRKEPRLPFKFVYDSFGEIECMVDVPQIDVFTGWLISPKNQ
jgi:hypothetical protein